MTVGALGVIEICATPPLFPPPGPTGFDDESPQARSAAVMKIARNVRAYDPNEPRVRDIDV
jgi:hypothetical protein